ncbi:MAG: RNA methyltransferase [Crenarchaeota archaeon]|nr:RNA methyltransferase [Thermoproteota archaeon]
MQLSILLPASVIGVSEDLRVKTFRAGLVGRAAAIFMVDEIVIYLDNHDAESMENQRVFSRLLNYMVVPQYLRRLVFKKHEELRFAGLLPPLKIPSHTVPASLKHVKPGSFRLAVIVKVDRSRLVLEAGLEKTLLAPTPEPPLEARVGSIVLARVEDPSRLSAKIVSPREPPFYLGYRVSTPKKTLGEFLGSVEAVKIGTSKYGDLVWKRLDELRRLFSGGERVMVAFGSPSTGLREILAREGVRVEDVFNMFVNTVGEQGVETVRTEEALYITLPLLASLARGYW